MIYIWLVASIGLVLMTCLFVSYPLMKSRQLLLGLGVAFVVLLSSVLLYSYLGNLSQTTQWLSQGHKNHELKKQFIALGSLDDVVARMEKETKNNPSDPKRWYLLGRLYYTKGDHKSASHAFSHAYSLDNQDPMIILNYARSLYFEAPENLALAMKLSKEAQQKQPNNEEINQFINELTQKI